MSLGDGNGFVSNGFNGGADDSLYVGNIDEYNQHGWVQKWGICFAAGSKIGNDPIYAEHVREFCKLSVQYGIERYGYGGGQSGLMGVVSQTLNKPGIHLYGVTLHRFGSSQGISGEHVKEIPTNTLRARNEVMYSDFAALVAFGGGIGSLYEIFDFSIHGDIAKRAAPNEIIRPVILINTNGIYDHEIAGINQKIKAGFIASDRVEKILYLVNDPKEAIKIIRVLDSEPPIYGRDLLTKHAEADQPVLGANGQHHNNI